MRLLPCGDTGILVEVDDLAEALGLYTELAERDLEGVVALVPAARTVLVEIDPERTTTARIARDVAELEPGRGARPAVSDVEIPVVYDGDDLHEVAEVTGLGVAGVIAAHTGQLWTVGFVGFAPGFGYLVGEDDRLSVPRRPHPRSAVPAGAVGLAGEYSGVYPRRSPGGWQLIGRTDVAMWDVARDPPALLQPAATVRFRQVR